MTETTTDVVKHAIDGLIAAGEFERAAKLARQTVTPATATGAAPATATAAAGPLKGAALAASAKAEGRLLTRTELRGMSMAEMGDALAVDRAYIERSVAEVTA